MRHLLLLLFLFLAILIGACQQKILPIKTGADQMDTYIPKLQGKKIGLFVNHTSLVDQSHLTDTLMNRGINITKVFTPEHGFKGNKSDGEKIEQESTLQSFQLISLYGAAKRPTDEQMAEIDLLVVDIQDVGVRCYTYASTMTYLMEAAARNKIPVLILDRPNPNGSYIDGPVLKLEFASFVGLHPIPFVHGLTLGELAMMINGEGWLGGQLQCDLEIIKILSWDHDQPYDLPVKPSPNLPNALAVALYPSLTLFEGTTVSIGRGTEKPFQLIGHPNYPDTAFSFIPKPNEGSKYPPLEGKKCFGIDLSDQPITYQFDLKYLLDFYQSLAGANNESFFNSYFIKLAGTDQLQKAIEMGEPEERIRDSWKSDLNAFKIIREKYLLYQ